MTSGAAGLLEPEKISEVIRQWESNDALFSSSLQSGVPPAQALAKLGIRLCIQERYPESLAVLDAAVTLAPGDLAMLNNLAVVQERSGQTDSAIRSVERSLALSHAQPDSWLFLGNMKGKQGDLPAAQTAYETALALEPNSPLAWQALGLVKQQQRKYSQAIDCLMNCIRQSYVTTPILSILGQLFYETGQFEKSRNAYAAALENDAQHPVYRRMLRETQFICAIIQGNPVDDAINAYLADRSAFPVADGKALPELLQVTFSLLNAYGHKDAACRVGSKRVALFPTSATAAYLLHAISGDAPIPRSPDAYIVEYFNEFADRFDHHLVTTLGYDIPEKLGIALAGMLPSATRVDVLDAGCGTGLCGPWVRGFSASLTGVDLSPGMLDRARQRGIYNRLVCRELTAFLADSPAGFDVIIAADVMIYFGDLAPLAAALAKSLRPGGLLALSIERATAPGHHLLSSGRFAHHPDYVKTAFGADFITCLSQDTTVRLEAALPVAGNVFVFRRR